MFGKLNFVLYSLAFAAAAPITSPPKDPDKSDTMLCLDQFIALTEGYQIIVGYVGESCKLVFPKISEDQSVVFLKTAGSQNYVGGCRDDNDLQKSLDPSFTNQVEGSDCKMADEGFNLTFTSLSINFTSNYTWRSGGKKGSIYLSIIDRGGGNNINTPKVSTIFIVIVVMAVLAVIVAAFVMFSNVLDIIFVPIKDRLQDYSCFKNGGI